MHALCPFLLSTLRVFKAIYSLFTSEGWMFTGYQSHSSEKLDIDLTIIELVDLFT